MAGKSGDLFVQRLRRADEHKTQTQPAQEKSQPQPRDSKNTQWFTCAGKNGTSTSPSLSSSAADLAAEDEMKKIHGIQRARQEMVALEWGQKPAWLTLLPGLWAQYSSDDAGQVWRVTCDEWHVATNGCVQFTRNNATAPELAGDEAVGDNCCCCCWRPSGLRLITTQGSLSLLPTTESAAAASAVAASTAATSVPAAASSAAAAAARGALLFWGDIASTATSDMDGAGGAGGWRMRVMASAAAAEAAAADAAADVSDANI
jgi:hypothetical protein